MNKLYFWTKFLLFIISLVIWFGLMLVLLPHLSIQGFSLMIYGSGQQILGFPEAAIQYISLAHAVFGSVMIGWGFTLFFFVNSSFRNSEPNAWKYLCISILAWFIPDTAFSVFYGFYPNAILNIALLTLFAIPLANTYNIFKSMST